MRVGASYSATKLSIVATVTALTASSRETVGLTLPTTRGRSNRLLVGLGSVVNSLGEPQLPATHGSPASGSSMVDVASVDLAGYDQVLPGHADALEHAWHVQAGLHPTNNHAGQIEQC